MIRLFLKILIFVSIPITIIFAYEKNYGSMSWTTKLGIFYKGQTYSCFYPYLSTTRTREGDLSRGTIYAKRYIDNVETDEIGFRNKPGTTLHNNDVIVIGDSFSAIYDYNLPRVIENKSKLSVLSLSYPTNKVEAYFEINNKFRQKPKVIIYQILERDIINRFNGTSTSNEFDEKLKNTVGALFINKYVLTIAHNIDLLFKDDYKIHLERCINKSLGNTVTELPTTMGYSAIDGDNILFYNGAFRLDEVSNNELNYISDQIKELYLRFKEENIILIFVAVPNKETIYFDYLPDYAQPYYKGRDFLPRLHNELKTIGVPSVDLYSTFIREFNNGKRMYLPDDTHWNETGVEIASDLIVAELNKLKPLNITGQ